MTCMLPLPTRSVKSPTNKASHVVSSFKIATRLSPYASPSGRCLSTLGVGGIHQLQRKAYTINTISSTRTWNIFSIKRPRPYSSATKTSITTSKKATRSHSTHSPKPQTSPPSTQPTTTPSTTMTLSIRAIEEPDKSTWENLWSQYNTFYKRTIPSEVTSTTFTRFLDPATKMYCAVAVNEDPYHGEHVIGFITWYPHQSTSSINDIVYIHDLFVDPQVRNKGTGRKLIEHVYEYAKGIEASQVYWHTQYFNHVGQILYTKVADRTDFVKYAKML